MVHMPKLVYEDDQFFILKFSYDDGNGEIFVFSKQNTQYISLDYDGNVGGPLGN